MYFVFTFILYLDLDWDWDLRLYSDVGSDFCVLIWYGTATSKRKWRFTGIRGHYWAQKPSGLLKVTSCCLRQLWLLLYTLLSTVASPVVHMHREHISILYLWMLFYPFSSDISKRPCHSHRTYRDEGILVCLASNLQLGPLVSNGHHVFFVYSIYF